MSAQVIVNGILLGGLYASIGVGFSIVWGVMNIMNLAHGSVIMVGAYISYLLFHFLGVDPFLSIPICMIGAFLLAYGIQSYLLNFVVKAGVFMTLILTFGVQIILVNIALLIFGGDYLAVVPSYAGAGFEVGSVRVPYIRLGILAVSFVLSLLLSLFVSKTKAGNAIQATGLNKEAAQLVGVNLPRIYALTFGIGGALAGAAGALMSPIFVITPVLGVPLLGRAFAVTALGGLGSMAGPLVGGLILGLAETVGSAYLGPHYQEAISFVMLLLILLFRPQGVFGKRFFAEI
jgi:branched-chain amino acid transport system permease protein